MTTLRQRIILRLLSYLWTILLFSIATMFNPCLSRGSGQDAANGQWRVTSVTEISPDQSSLQESDPNGASGGRINGLAMAHGDKIVYAASEWEDCLRAMIVVAHGDIWTPIFRAQPGE